LAKNNLEIQKEDNAAARLCSERFFREMIPNAVKFWDENPSFSFNQIRKEKGGLFFLFFSNYF
jgi:hypothetical protein